MTAPLRFPAPSLACPTCQRPWPLEAPPALRPLTARELDVLSAWFHYRSVKLAAFLIGVGEQRAKNLLARARDGCGAQNNNDLAGLYLGLLRSKAALMAQHNVGREEG